MLNDPYRGREHSRVKHLFLAEYLLSAAYKSLNQSGRYGSRPIFNYVDGFAGPWSVGDADTCADSSFDNAVRVLSRVREDLVAKGMSQPTVRFFLCERDPNRFARLERYAESKRGIDIRVFKGAFEDHLATIEAACGRGFTFTFIDPTGWNLRSAEIAGYLARVRGDFLLNFMSEPINRHASYSKSEESFGRFLADPDWKSKLEADLSDEKIEVKVLNLLRARMKTLGAANFLPHFAISRTRENRVQMRLVLGTRHPAGVFVFRAVESKVEQLQVEQRRKAREEGLGLQSLFSDGQLNALELQRDGVGSSHNRAQAKRFLAGQIKLNGEGIVFRLLAARCMTAVPVRETHVKDLLSELRAEGLVAFTLPANKRKLDMDDVVFPAGA